MKSVWLAVLPFFLSVGAFAKSSGGGGVRSRGVDFRMQVNSGALNFTNISGVKRDFTGFGSELSAHLYWLEKARVSSNFFLATRVMSYTSHGVALGETDDIQVFTLAPGLELSLGMLHFQVGYQAMNANSYFISSFSSARTFAMGGLFYGAHLNFRMGHLGLGIGATLSDFAVDPTKLGLASTVSSQWKEISYSFNMIYFMGKPPAKFFKELFK